MHSMSHNGGESQEVGKNATSCISHLKMPNIIKEIDTKSVNIQV